MLSDKLFSLRSSAIGKGIFRPSDRPKVSASFKCNRRHFRSSDRPFKFGSPEWTLKKAITDGVSEEITIELNIFIDFNSCALKGCIEVFEDYGTQTTP